MAASATWAVQEISKNKSPSRNSYRIQLLAQFHQLIQGNIGPEETTSLEHLKRFFVRFGIGTCSLGGPDRFRLFHLSLRLLKVRDTRFGCTEDLTNPSLWLLVFIDLSVAKTGI